MLSSIRRNSGKELLGHGHKGLSLMKTPHVPFLPCYPSQSCLKKSDNLLTASILVGIITSA